MGGHKNCSFHSSCNSSEFGAPSSYTTSLSTDTLYNYDNASMQQASKSPQAMHHHQRYHHSHHQVQPLPPQPAPVTCMHKPKSWDNLAAKGFGGYGFGYGYVDTTSVVIPNTNKTFVTIHHRHSIPRKTVNTYHNGGYNSIIPPPTQFIQETTTTMTTITTNLQQSTKSTENLIGYNMSADSSCECVAGGAAGAVVNRGFYSNLSRQPSNCSTTGRVSLGAQTVSEMTKL
jgi:general receptor for phosphoinositides 1-associated scaffold protein